MATCNVQSLMNDARYFNGLSHPQLLAIIAQLLCDIAAAGGGTGTGLQQIYPAGTVAPDDPTKPALRYTGDPPTPMEQWDVTNQIWV